MPAKTTYASNVDSPLPMLEPVETNPPAVIALSQHTKASSTQEPRDIQVQLQYLKNDPLYKTVKPLQIVPGFADYEGKSNVKLSPGFVETIKDIRGVDTEFSLDANGFKYVHAPTAFRDWASQPKIGQEYLPEMEALLRREVTGCDEIIFYDARIRQESDEGVRVEGLSYNPFARQVHVDNTESSVITKIRMMTEMKADYLLSGRAQIINIWRPIKHPVYDCGLAIADGGKLRDGDVIECDRHRKDTGEFWDTMGVVKYRLGYDWYYKSEQDESDVLLFKNYDSAKDVQARHCLHTAFDLPPETVPFDAPTRESIEVRALVFTYPKVGPRPLNIAVQHPLAISLQQGHLRRIDREHSVTDRLRTDIDEGNEVKDAMLLLRRRQIRELERARDALIAERDFFESDLAILKREKNAFEAQLKQSQEQLKTQRRSYEALEIRTLNLEQQLGQKFADERGHHIEPSAEHMSATLREYSRAREESEGITVAGDIYGPDSETMLLSQTIERQQREIEQWKNKAMGKGNEAMSRSWQASVNEAVRAEREKDASIIRQMSDLILRLQMVGTRDSPVS